MQLLKANTAVDVLIGPFVDDTDGKTAETALTLSQADIKLSKNGQTLAQKSDVTAAAHDASGYYNCELDATDTNTEGTLVLIVAESGALPVRHEFMVLAEAAYDSMFTAKDTGYMDVNIKAVSEDTTAADNLELACDNYSATRGLSGTALPAAAADGVGGLPISDAGGLDLDGLNTNVSAILTDTGTTLDNHLTDIKGTGFVKDTHSLVDIEAYVDLIDDGTSGLAKIATDVAAVLVDTNELQTDDVPGLIAALNDPTAAAIADAVWDETLSGHLGAGSCGEALNAAGAAGDPWSTAIPGAYGAGSAGYILGNNINAPLNTIDSNVDAILVDTAEIGAAGAGLSAIPWNASWDTEVQSECTDALNAYDPPTKTELDSAFTEIKGATWASGTDTLEHIRDKQTDIETDTQAIETDTQDIQSRIPAALVSGRMSSDAVAISGSTDAADNLQASAQTIVVDTVGTGYSETTTTLKGGGTATLDATDDHYNGRIIIFTSGVLQNQATDITDYDGTTKVFTVTALTEAASDGDSFVIV